MNGGKVDRLTIAAMILAGQIADCDLDSFENTDNCTARSRRAASLRWADALIADHRETKPVDALVEPAKLPAWVRKGAKFIDSAGSRLTVREVDRKMVRAVVTSEGGYDRIEGARELERGWPTGDLWDPLPAEDEWPPTSVARAADTVAPCACPSPSPEPKGR